MTNRAAKVTQAQIAEPPLYMADEAIAARVIGRDRVREWPGIVCALEKHGFPQTNPLFGGRYWPAVRVWLDHFNGISDSQAAPIADGVEDMGQWKKVRRRA